MDYDTLIRCLVLVRLGQELGTETPLARAVFQILCALQDFCP
jgi:hypothetical protein